MAVAPKKSEKPRVKGEDGEAPVPASPSIWVQLAAAFAVFIVLSVGYSYARQYFTDKSEEVPLSQIAVDIEAGKIASIQVAGDKITATYVDEAKKTSRKERESSLVQTLSDYGLAIEKLAAVKISIKDEGGGAVLGAHAAAHFGTDSFSFWRHLVSLAADEGCRHAGLYLWAIKGAACES